MKHPYFMLSWRWDRSGRHPQPILRAFLRAVLAELWWKKHLRWLGRRTKIYDKFKSPHQTSPPQGKYITMKLSTKEKL